MEDSPMRALQRLCPKLSHRPPRVGQVDRKTGGVIRKDPGWLAASPVLIREIRVNGKAMGV